MIRRQFVKTVAGLALLASTALPAVAHENHRVLSIGGSVTEIIYALGAGDRLIARDTTSSYPEAANALPDVGYIRALSPEGVLSVNPELIISESGAGPIETLDVLKKANVPFIEVPEDYSAQGIADKIAAVGAALDLQDEAAALSEQVTAELLDVSKTVATIPEAERKRVLFVLSAGGGRIMASGTGSAADAIIRMAGGINAISEFEGYKPMTDEAVTHAAPDVILMMDRGGDHSASNTELLSRPALITTPVAETKSVIRMDGLYILGFGPRTAQAALDLAHALYGEF